MSNVFTGGHVESNNIVEGEENTKERPYEKPISLGEYSILENKGNDKVAHNSFFVLDPTDNDPYDKEDDRPGEINIEGAKRSGYNLHPGTISHGCVIGR